MLLIIPPVCSEPGTALTDPPMHADVGRSSPGGGEPPVPRSQEYSAEILPILYGTGLLLMRNPGNA